ncbi:MAG: hypothetical protein IIB37_04485 [Gemmatimonadetes bacterium]|nr:hypothetical protein [Gemmatimonadota bacterium]
MNPPTAGRNIFRRGGASATLLIGAVICVSACGGAESSEAAASEAAASEAAVSGSPEAAVSRGAASVAPLGTGFIMLSAQSQLHLDEPSYLEESDCTRRVSTREDAEEYAGCMEIPRTAICLQVTVGYQESDRWWECFVEPVACEDRAGEHDLLWQLVKDARAILQPCADRELASVFGV